MTKPIASRARMLGARVSVMGLMSLTTLRAELAPLSRTATVADPHAGRCGEGVRRRPSLPDLTPFSVTRPAWALRPDVSFREGNIPWTWRGLS